MGSISYRDLFDLRDRLADAQFAGFHGLRYGMLPSSDTRTYTLVGGQEDWVVQYDTEVVEQLPTELQQLIDLWFSLGLERR